MDPLSLQVLLGQLDKVAKMEDLTKEHALIHRNNTDVNLRKRSYKDGEDIPETKHIFNLPKTGTHQEEHKRKRSYNIKKSQAQSKNSRKRSKAGKSKSDEIGRMIDLICIF